MRPLNRLDSSVRCVLLSGALALAGCVPSGFIYDLPQERYYNSGGRYYSAAAPGFYGQPAYYGQSGYAPRVVYVDHDHDRDDCRHESHRKRRDERKDRDGRGTPADSPTPPRAPRGVTPRGPEQTTRPQTGRDACTGGKKCGPAARTPEVEATRRGAGTREGSRLVEQ